MNGKGDWYKTNNQLKTAMNSSSQQQMVCHPVVLLYYKKQK